MSINEQYVDVSGSEESSEQEVETPNFTLDDGNYTARGAVNNNHILLINPSVVDHPTKR